MIKSIILFVFFAVIMPIDAADNSNSKIINNFFTPNLLHLSPAYQKQYLTWNEAQRVIKPGMVAARAEDHLCFYDRAELVCKVKMDQALKVESLCVSGDKSIYLRFRDKKSQVFQVKNGKMKAIDTSFHDVAHMSVQRDGNLYFIGRSFNSNHPLYCYDQLFKISGDSINALDGGLWSYSVLCSSADGTLYVLGSDNNRHDTLVSIKQGSLQVLYSCADKLLEELKVHEDGTIYILENSFLHDSLKCPPYHDRTFDNPESKIIKIKDGIIYTLYPAGEYKSHLQGMHLHPDGTLFVRETLPDETSRILRFTNHGAYSIQSGLDFISQYYVLPSKDILVYGFDRNNFKNRLIRVNQDRAIKPLCTFSTSYLNDIYVQADHTFYIWFQDAGEQYFMAISPDGTKTKLEGKGALFKVMGSI